MAQKLSEHLGRNVVVENRGEATGNIGTGLAASDGYTIDMTLAAYLAVDSGFCREPA